MPTSKCYLLGVPQEIRYLIYHHVFAGAQLTIEQEQHQPIHSPVTHIYRSPSFRTELLRVNKQIQTESFPVLANSTSVILLPGILDPNDAIKAIPPIWLSHLRTVLNNVRIRSRITHVLRQQHLNPSPFPNLRVYRIAHLVYPDWRDSCHKPEDVEAFVQSQLESDFFFQAGTLRLFTRTRTYALTTTLWLLRAFVEESFGWEVDFSLDTWTVLRKTRAKFHRRKNVLGSLCDDPKCRDYRNYDVQFLDG